MGRFDSIYLFTTENIAGYMRDLDLTGKKVVTVTGSTDHIINIVARGAKEILTFDINPLVKEYMDLKLSAIRTLSFKEFVLFLLFDSPMSFAYEIIKDLPLLESSKRYWLNLLSTFNNDGLLLKHSSIFNLKYFNPKSKLWQNLYLDEQTYLGVQKRLMDVEIKYVNCDLKKLDLKEDFDYMFLSNISDYIKDMYESGLISYRELMKKFLMKVKTIYMAYLYDIGNKNPRSEIDDLNNVSRLFSNYEVKKFKSALETNESKEDGVIILRK